MCPRLGLPSEAGGAGASALKHQSIKLDILNGVQGWRAGRPLQQGSEHHPCMRNITFAGAGAQVPVRSIDRSSWKGLKTAAWLRHTGNSVRIPLVRLPPTIPHVCSCPSGPHVPPSSTLGGGVHCFRSTLGSLIAAA
jgi:hypothetical protein